MNIEEEYEAMIASKSIYGTILRQNNNMQLYWSPLNWNSPKDGQLSQPELWVWIGVEGWWKNKKHKNMFFELLSLVGSFPSWAGENDYLGEKRCKPLQQRD